MESATASDLDAVGELLVVGVNLDAGFLVELQLALGSLDGDGGLGFFLDLECANQHTSEGSDLDNLLSLILAEIDALTVNKVAMTGLALRNIGQLIGHLIAVSPEQLDQLLTDKSSVAL